MARKKSTPHDPRKTKLTTAGRVYQITPKKETGRRAQVSTIGKPEKRFTQKQPGMRRVRQAAYQAAGAGFSAPNYAVTISGKINESEGEDVPDPFDKDITLLVTREDLLDALAHSKNAEEFAEQLGSYSGMGWESVGGFGFSPAS